VRCVQLRDADVNASLGAIVKLVSVVSLDIRNSLASPNSKVEYIRLLAGLKLMESFHPSVDRNHVLDSSPV